MHCVFRAPVRYVQGEGVTERLAVEMAVLGLHGPVLVIAGSSAVTATDVTADESMGSRHNVPRLQTNLNRSNPGPLEGVVNRKPLGPVVVFVEGKKGEADFPSCALRRIL